MDSTLRSILLELQKCLAAIYGDRFCHLLLFGSQARGDAEGDSDIDVLVVLKGRVEPCAEIARTERLVSELSLAYDVVIVCVFVSLEDYQERQSPLLTNIRLEGVTI